MLDKVIVLIIASQGYQPLEYCLTMQAVQEAGIKVVVGSDKPGIAVSKDCGDENCKECPIAFERAGKHIKAQVDLVVPAIDPANYDGIFLIGGPGAMECLDKPDIYSLMQKTAQLGKPFGAICISPRILAHAGLLKGKKATGWDGDHQLAEIFKQFGVTYVQEPVVVDGNLITATGPSAATAFGEAIVRWLRGK